MHKELNSQQMEAVRHEGTPLLLVAGAGSGKTKVLTHKIAQIIKQGTNKNRILAITFTKKAANEMNERLEKMLKIKPAWISTFHSFCVRILREEITAAGYNKNFVIYDEDDCLKILKDILKKNRIAPKEAKDAKEVISKAKQEYGNIFNFIEKLQFPKNKYLQTAIAYQAELSKSNALDFDDLVFNTVKILSEHKSIKEKWKNKFDWIMVDEYQDTNKIQYLLIQLLAEGKSNVFAVGDPQQCIYEWRGSAPDQMLNFVQDFKAKTLKLEKNYRSTRKILDIANTIISSAEKKWGDMILRLDANKEEEGIAEFELAETGNMECEKTADTIKELSREHKYSDFAVLIRMSFLSRGMEYTFMRREIPYEIIGGLAFYDRAEVKDLIAYLRFMVNKQDRAAFERIINIPQRGIGEKALSRIRESFRTDWIQALRDTRLSPKQRSNTEIFERIITGHSQEAEEKPFKVIMELIKEINYEGYLKKEYKEEYDERLQNISELTNVLEETEAEGKTFTEFLENNLLSSEQDKISKKDSVKIMTIHAAKGLEWSVVFLPALEEEIFPSSRSLTNERALEEERRLFYVACTRAKEKLFMSAAETRMKFGKESFMKTSRYIEEINIQEN